MSQRCLMHIIAKLQDAGVIGVSKGMFGGYIRSDEASHISMYDVVSLMEGISVPGEGSSTIIRCGPARCWATQIERPG